MMSLRFCFIVSLTSISIMSLRFDFILKICLLPLKTGPCRADFPMYGYDVSQKKCVEFQYGGCRGNRNNFKTLEDCQQTCESNDKPPEKGT
ncbi:unnamed protein product [Nesidiocoris tenuis]|uniref:BPTI/Kunitz inhibitor domain-containing protein n=1 Tax=Nesidiocoris tenuis TaxID=355587 RepID=A0A6H5GS30_9HEMI|nr:unnamed protein product [Nesidiocoris tenuis]